MPRFQPKAIQAELNEGRMRSFYWIDGPEVFLSRQLLRKIQKVAIGEDTAYWRGRSFDSSEVGTSAILDALCSQNLWGRPELILIRNPEQLKKIEILFSSRAPQKNHSIAIFFTHATLKRVPSVVLEKAAVVSCESIPESKRLIWVDFLAQQKKLPLTLERKNLLCLFEPWSLNALNQELEKLSLCEEGDAPQEAYPFPEIWIQDFFTKNLASALVALPRFVMDSEKTLPLLGLLNWNVKQISLFLIQGTAPSYLHNTLNQWKPHWTLSQLIQLQSNLASLDKKTKESSFSDPLGLWTELILRHLKS